MLLAGFDPGRMIPGAYIQFVRYDGASAGDPVRDEEEIRDNLISAPSGDMTPLGYVVMQPSMRSDRPVQAYQTWLDRIPGVYAKSVLGVEPAVGTQEIATVRNYRSLMPLAHDARKPMFDLKPADGAIGSTQRYVQTCLLEFRFLARNVLGRLEIAEPPR